MSDPTVASAASVSQGVSLQTSSFVYSHRVLLLLLLLSVGQTARDPLPPSPSLPLSPLIHETLTERR